MSLEIQPITKCGEQCYLINGDLYLANQLSMYMSLSFLPNCCLCGKCNHTSDFTDDKQNKHFNSNRHQNKYRAFFSRDHIKQFKKQYPHTDNMAIVFLN